MEKVQKPVEELDELCPTCGKHLVIRSGRFGKFISCSGYPECSYKRALVNKTGVLCPVDGGDLVERRGKKTGKVFYGCANFPTCNFVVWDRPLTVPCPECGGLLTLPNGKDEAACVKCGALVKGALEGAPVVVGHRAITERPARAARASSNGRSSSAKSGAKAKAPTRLKAKTTTNARDGEEVHHNAQDGPHACGGVARLGCVCDFGATLWPRQGENHWRAERRAQASNDE